ncbi:LuxR family transcriptional regulator [Cereibacter sphaeroides]|nr:LuxR family transcriptional regulator [Cereibacter sphaeroides]
MEHLKFFYGTGGAPVFSVSPVAADGADVSQLLAYILSSTDQAAIWNALCHFFSELGFAQILYGYSPDSRGAILGAPEDYLILSTMPGDALQEMVQNGYYLMSSTFHWALNNAGVASWTMTPQDCGFGPDFVVSPEGAEFFQRNGLMTGCTIGFTSERTRGRGVMALIAPESVPQADVDALLARMQDTIFSVAAVGHRCLSGLPYLPPGRRLTQRQREVLEWVGDGKTTADIAVIMGITVPTVEKHLRLARQTLGVETTAHALMKAAFLNQVFVTAPRENGAQDAVSGWDL